MMISSSASDRRPGPRTRPASGPRSRGGRRPQTSIRRSKPRASFLLVIGDVGGQVGVHAVGALQHPVLVVAEGRRAQPQGAPRCGTCRPGARAPRRQPPPGWISLVQAALGEPLVKADAEALKRGPDQLQAGRHGLAGQLVEVELAGALGGHELCHVVPAVAVLGDFFAARPGAHRLGQADDLTAVVVDVVLAVHGVPVEAQDPRQGGLRRRRGDRERRSAVPSGWC